MRLLCTFGFHDWDGDTWPGPDSSRRCAECGHFWELKRAALAEPEVVTCELCDTVQARPECECVHCGAGPKYLTVSPVPVQQEPEGRCPRCGKQAIGKHTGRCVECNWRPAAVPSSDELRDRIAEALWRHDAQIDFPQVGWACEATTYEKTIRRKEADAVLAVLRSEGLLR